MTNDTAVVLLEDADALAWEAATRVATAARAAVRERGRFALAISGGSTPLRLFRLLALAEWQVRLPWAQTSLFWVDERCVPSEHPDSNFGAATGALIGRLTPPPAAVHRWLGEGSDPVAEAARYARLLARHLPLNAEGVPVLDLVLLGLGPDGHTASLFPHTAALAVVDQPTAASYVPQLNAWRLTLTYPAIRSARESLMLVSGADKAVALRRVLRGAIDVQSLPAQALLGNETPPVWLVDRAAAAELR